MIIRQLLTVLLAIAISCYCYVVVTCEIKLFQPLSMSDQNNFMSVRRNVPGIISQAYCSL